MNESLLLKRVEYQTSFVDGGVGLVIAHALESGRVVVVDEDDGSRWTGYDEHISVLED